MSTKSQKDKGTKEVSEPSFDDSFDYLFDTTTKSYVYAYRKGIGVEYVYSFLAPKKNMKLGKDYYYDIMFQFDKRVRYKSLIDIVGEMGKKGSHIKDIRDYIRNNYRYITTDNVVVAYEHLFPLRILSNRYLLGGIKYTAYDPEALKDKYQNMKQRAKGYKNIIDRSRKLIKDLMDEKSVKTTVPTTFNQNITFTFNTDLTPEQFFGINSTSGVLFFLSYLDIYKVFTDFNSKTLKTHFSKGLPTDDMYMLLLFKRLEHQYTLKIKIEYDQKRIFIKNSYKVGQTYIKDLLNAYIDQGILKGIRNVRISQSENFIGSFDMFAKKYQPMVMSYIIMNIDPVSDLLYIDEKGEPSVSKGEGSVYHMNPVAISQDLKTYQQYNKNNSIIRFNIKRIKAKGQDIYTWVKDGKLIEEKYPEGSIILRISFNHAQTLKDIYILREYMSRLYTIINKKYQTVRTFYKNLGYKIGLKQETKGKQKQETRVELLNNLFEQVYGIRPKGYASQCGKTRQPKIIDSDEYIKGQAEKPKSYMKIKDDQGKDYYLYCDHDKQPDIHYHESGLPCCFVLGKKPKKKRTGLEPGNMTEVNEILWSWLNNIKKGKYYRLGATFDDENSFYSCIVNSKFPNTIRNKEATQARIKELKYNIKKRLKTRNYVLQESKIESVKELLSLVTKGGKNTDIFYSIIQYIYQVNIFIFISHNNQYQYVEYPKEPFYIRENPGFDQSIVLIKHKHLSYYEIVAYYSGNGEPTKYIELETLHRNIVTRGLYDSWYFQYNTDVSIYDPYTKIHTTYNNLYNRLEYWKLAYPTKQSVKDKYKIESFQMADPYKKIRAIVLKLMDKKKRTYTYLKIYTYPTYYNPKLGPIVSDVDEINETYPKFYTVLNYFNYYPFSATVVDDMVTGFWYPFQGLSNGFYCHIDRVKLGTVREILKNRNIGILRDSLYSEKVELAPPPYIDQEEMSDIELYKYNNTLAKNTLTLVSYLYSSSGLYIEQFIKYLILDTSLAGDDIPSDQIYNLDYLNSSTEIILPKKRSIQALKTIMKSLESKLSPLIAKDKIVCYSKKMYDGIVYYLGRYDLDKAASEKYLRYTSFQKENDQAILKSPTQFNIWLENKNKYNIKYNLAGMYDNESTIPVIYTHNNKFYLIQKTKAYDFYRCVTVSYTWHQKKINLGPNAKKYHHIVKGINIIPDTEILTVDRGDRIVFPKQLGNKLMVLYHIPGKYSSVLPL